MLCLRSTPQAQHHRNNSRTLASDAQVDRSICNFQASCSQLAQILQHIPQTQHTDPVMTKNWLYNLTLLLIGASMLTFSTAASSENRRQDHAAITQAVSDACQAQAAAQGYDDVEVVVHKLDSNLALPACSKPLSTILPQPERATGQVSVGVRCDSEQTPWTIYARAMVSALQRIPVFNKPLSKGHIITAADLSSQTLPARSVVKDVALAEKQLIGQELTRNLSAGTPVRLRHLRAPELIKQGQQVMLVARGNGVEIKVKGKAQHGGAVGDAVRVTNLSSGQTVQGIVEADGTVGIY